MKRALVFGAALACAAGCGEPPDVFAYDVTLTPISDCRQTGQSTQCELPDVVSRTITQGRWLLERRPSSRFVLTLDDGATVTGLTFPNDGTNDLVVAPPDRPEEGVGCSGEGGVCFFARRGAIGTDAASGCPRTDTHAVIVHEVEGALRGQVVDLFETAADCGTPTAAVRVVSVEGTLVDEPSLAREEYAP